MANYLQFLNTDPFNSQPLQFPENDDGPVFLEYIALDYTKVNITTKTLVVETEPKNIKDCPTGSFNTYDSEVASHPCPELALVPVAMYRDPFRKGKHKIVLCELQTSDGKPLEINRRVPCQELMEKVKEEDIWLGFEQEYFFIDENGVPFDMELIERDTDFDVCCELFMGKHTGKQRELADLHLRACVFAGLKMYGLNREAAPSQWEYQTGPLPAMEACDQLIVARYILFRIAEMSNIQATFFTPKCIRVSSLAATLHTNFSTKKMRDEGGIKYINEALETIAGHNQESILKYYDLVKGNDYKWRLSGSFYQPKYDTLVIKVGDKSDSSLRIPTRVAKEGKGYFEERRPAGEANPYELARVLTAAALFKTNV